MVIRIRKQKEERYTDALEQLAHIKSITAQKRKYGKQTGPYLIIWGAVWLIGYGINLLDFTHYWTWIVLSIFGWITTIITMKRQNRGTHLPNYVKLYVKYITGTFIGIFVIFSFLIANQLLVFSDYYLGLYTVLLIAVMYMLLGTIIGSEIFIVGIWLGVLSMGTFVWFSEYMNLIFSVVGGGGMISIGYRLKKNG